MCDRFPVKNSFLRYHSIWASRGLGGISPSVFSRSRQHVETNVLSAAIDATGWGSGSSLEMIGFIRARLMLFDGRRCC